MKTIYLFLLLVFISPIISSAQWDGNAATVYNPVGTTTDNEPYAFTVTDGAGGIIAVWGASDFNSNETTIYCQRKTASGVIAWGDSSSPVLLADNFPAYSLVSVTDVKPDGSGGAYITWSMETMDLSEIYLQRIDSNGTTLFIQGGVKIMPALGNFAYGGKITTNAAGVFVCWSEHVQDADSVLPSYAEVMVQRYSEQGQPQWSTAVAVSTVPAFRAIGQLVSDGNDGIFIAFFDSRNSNFDEDGNADNIDVYAQHIDSNGNRLWQQDAAISTEAFNQLTIDDGGSQVFSSIVSDNAGGFILLYNAYPDGNTDKVRLYAQRVDHDGIRLWPAAGVELYSPLPSSNIRVTQVLPDGNGGMVASWDVNYFSGFGEVYVQRVTAAGDIAWGTNGIKISPFEPGYHDQSTLIADEAGSYIASWSNRLEFAIKAQKIDSTGQLQWDAAGVNICTNQFSVPSQPILTKSDGNNIIAVWGDQRNTFTDNASDLYAAKFDGNGNLIHSGAYISVANGNWDDPATWLSNSVPPFGADVLVRHDVIANINASCKSLTVQQPGSLTVIIGVEIILLQ